MELKKEQYTEGPEKGPDPKDSQKGVYLTFHLHGEDYGIETCHVIEIIGVQEIARVPKTPPFIIGVINLRGQVIPVVEVRCRFGFDVKKYDESTCIVVVRLAEETVGLVVDRVNEVVEIDVDLIERAPRAAGEQINYMSGLAKCNDGVKILLDLEKFLYEGYSEVAPEE